MFGPHITINVPLILNMQDIIFFAGKIHNGIFRGGQDFLTPKFWGHFQADIIWPEGPFTYTFCSIHCSTDYIRWLLRAAPRLRAVHLGNQNHITKKKHFTSPNVYLGLRVKCLRIAKPSPGSSLPIELNSSSECAASLLAQPSGKDRQFPPYSLRSSAKTHVFWRVYSFIK